MASGKLGKLPATEDRRDITFEAFKAESGLSLPKAPSRFGHGNLLPWEMLGNGPDPSVGPGFKGAGCCVFSAMGEATRVANKLAGRTVHITGKETVSDYSADTGYVIGDDSTDNGTEMRLGMKYWAKTGIVDQMGNRHKIGAYLSVNPKDFGELMQAVYTFSVVLIGVDFPDSAWDGFDLPHPLWDYVPGAQSDGGHCIPVFGRSKEDEAGVVSWAERVGMTPEFYEAYNDETWVAVLPEELKNGKTERGHDLAALNSLLTQLGR